MTNRSLCDTPLRRNLRAAPFLNRLELRGENYIRGVVGGLWGMKVHRARAPARAWSRASGLRQLRLPAILVFKPRVKSSSQSRERCTFVLQDLLELAAGAAEQSRTNGAMLSESPAWALLMLARCTRSRFAPVRLPQPPIRRTRPRSRFTDHMLAPHACASGGAQRMYRQSRVLWLFDESGQPPLYRSVSVLQTHYSVKGNTHLLAGTER